jgi:DNA polymerase III subunit beta
MKVEILAENFNRGVGVVTRAVAGRPQLPVLSYVLINAFKGGLEFVATDLEISLVASVGAKITEEGSVLLPAKLLSDVVSNLPSGTISLELEKQVLKIKALGVETEITGMGVEEFPEVPRFKKADFVIDGENLKKKMNRVGVSAAREGMKPVYEGILWDIQGDIVNLASTDGYRLGTDEMNVSSSQNKKYILPVKALLELSRVMGESEIEIEFDEDKQQVCFKGGDVEMVSRLIGGDFPDYQQIIPNGKTVTVKIDRAELELAVKRAGVFARESSNIIKFKIVKDGIEISASSSDMGKNVSHVEAEVEGDEMVIAFNSRYLLEYLSVVDKPEVVFESAGEMKPGVFRLKSDSFVHIIMPIRQEGN